MLQFHFLLRRKRSDKQEQKNNNQNHHCGNHYDERLVKPVFIICCVHRQITSVFVHQALESLGEVPSWAMVALQLIKQWNHKCQLWLCILCSREMVELVKVEAGLCIGHVQQNYVVARIRTIRPGLSQASGFVSMSVS